ncbi:MAG TPA: ABC transporter permease [Candidatus Acidoferrales bacterium]|jgi:predicted permease|nr:ABC transporter permease [Candidatus Acidoferrales bacterium]
MNTLFGDIRYAIRAMRQSPGLYGLVLGILALGIAASVSVFSLVDGVVLRPLPYRDAGRLVALRASATKPPFDSNGSVAYTDFLQFQAQAHSYEDIAVMYRVGWSQVVLAGPGNQNGGERERVRGGFVSPNFFAMFGRAPMLGRLFTPEENLRGERVMLIGERLAERRFGSPAAALGRDLQTDGARWRIVGVMPSDFRVPYLDSQLWAPVMSHPEWNDKTEPQSLQRAMRWDLMARLRPGVGAAAAQSEADVIYGRLKQEAPEYHFDRAIVVPLRQHFTGEARRPLTILAAAVALLLLIALANAGNLLLARAAVRQREFAIRAALGAGTGRLLRQSLAETVTLCLLAGAAGAALALPLVRVLKSLAPGGTPRLDEVGVDFRVLLFAVAMSLAAGVCLGLVSVLRGLRRSTEALRTAGRSTTSGRETRRLKDLLVASEFALAMVLLTGAALLVRSFVEVMKVDLGFRPEHVLTMWVEAPGPEQTLSQFYRQALERIRNLPGVAAAGASSSVFQVGLTRTHALRQVEGHATEPAEKWGALEWSHISGDYFQAMGIPLLRGRYFDQRDVADAPPVVIVNETLARRYWPGEDPIGKRLKGYDPRGPNGGAHDDWLTVVGLVGDMRAAGRERTPFSQIYEVQGQRVDTTPLFVIRTAGDPVQLAAAARAAVRDTNRAARVSSVSTMEHMLDEQEGQRLFQTWLIGVFSALALGLAALGVFAVMHFAVAAKTREIGIRIAVGARAADILGLVLSDGVRLALAGIAAGALASAWTTEALAGLLFGVKPTDPASFAAAATVLATVAVAACYLPARRAARLDPVAALREE